MIIYSWNMLYRNEELDRAFEFIQSADFDFFCFQEVPEVFLKRLQTLGHSLAFGVDTEKIYPDRNLTMYNVILSKHSIIGQGGVSFSEQCLPTPFRTRLFIYLMKPFHFSKSGNREGLYADVLVGDVSFRIFSLHLALAHPGQRLSELKLALTKQDTTRQQIICGDFNILESWHITVLNWLLGGKITDVLFYKRERKALEKYFQEKRLSNPLRNSITHSLSRSQLDHILVSHSFSIKQATVLSDRLGSDHALVRAEIH